MPTVESRLTINASADAAYSAARDSIEKLPEFLANIDSIEVPERQEGRSVSKWVGQVQTPFGAPVRFAWTEEDIWDDETRTCTFAQTEGDFDQYEGTWRFAAEGDGCETHLTINFAKDIPGLGPLIQNLLQSKVQEMCDDTLQGLKRMIEGG
jgi:uncharacterized membrane protein